MASALLALRHCEAALQTGDINAAVFFGEKSLSLIKRASPADDAARRRCAFTLARVLFANAEYLRAHAVLDREGLLLRRYTEATLLASKCYVRANDLEAALDLIGEADEEGAEWEAGDGAVRVGLRSRTQAWRGEVFHLMENRAMATHWLIAALRSDPFNYEAFATLQEKHLLTTEQQEEVAQALKSHEGGAEWAGLFQEFYLCKLNPYVAKEIPRATPPDVDLETTRAEMLYYQCNTAASLKVCKSIWDLQSASKLLTTIYLACLVDTPSLADELFYVGHQLVAAKPHASVSWYAVGCYYLLIGKYDHSRHFFRRCTGIDPAFGEAWVGFAHAFALQGEHDQAMAAYRTAARMISNNHIPPLCIAMEYLRVNNVALALKFIDSAQQLCPSDALLFNEMGVAHYKEHEYAAALNCFQKVVSLVGQDAIRKRIEWESTLFNMGHVYRKLRNYAEAFKCFSLCLSLKPNNPSTLSAIGLTHHLNSNLDKAIEYYHLSLARSDDAFTSDLLKRALEDFTVNWSK